MTTIRTLLTSTKSLLVISLILGACLRLLWLNQIPPSLYWDEASIGYNAYAIANYGIDEHGVSFPITHFLAYGDAKPPLYIYFTAFFIKLLGPTEIAVRLTSALAGTLAIYLVYQISKILVTNWFHPKFHLTPIIAAFLFSISPWHILLSRGGFEANLALTLFLSAVLLFLKGLHRPILLPLSATAFIATLYTFNAYRIFLPIFLPFLGLIFAKQLLKTTKWVLLSIVLAGILISPLVPFAFSDQAQLRFNEVTIFNNLDPVLQANRYQELTNNSLLSRIIFNRRVFFTLEFIKHHTDHFKPDYLFFSGDENARFAVRDLGIMYPIELPLLLLGIGLLLKQPKKISILLLAWVLIGLIPAGIARETPHALRSLQTIFVPYFIAALAFSYLLIHSRILKYLVVGGYLLFGMYFVDLYYHHYSHQWANSWQYGYKQLYSYLFSIQDQYDRIYVTQTLGRPHTYLLFYGQVDPRDYVANRDAGQDNFGFTYTNSYRKFYFTEPPNDLDASIKKLIVSGKSEAYKPNKKIIYDLHNEPVFVISE